MRYTFLQVATAVALLVYLFTAYNSHGYYHADEHYQIVEFSGIKMGTHTPGDLAWEYGARIRPALQPTMCFLVFKMLNSVGVENPYTLVLWLRIITALLSIAVVTFFVKRTQSFFSKESHRRAYILLSYFLWFLPFLAVRFSSETYSGLMLLLALSLVLGKEQRSTPWLLGLVIGLGFLFRFQMAFVFAGFGLWLLVVRRVNFAYIIKVAVTFFVMVILGTLIDSWFYGEFVFTPFNYFKANIIEDVASTFGTSPWYFFLRKLITFPSVFVGVPLAIALVIMAVYYPQSIFFWCFVPLLVIHSIIPHKEERFLFPVIVLFPVMLVMAYQKVTPFFEKKGAARILHNALLAVFIAVNMVGVAAMSVRAAGVGHVGLTKHIHDNYGNRSVNILYTSWSNPYNPFGLPAKFYFEKDLDANHLENASELSDSLVKPNVVNLVVIGSSEADSPEWRSVLEKKGFVEECRTAPAWDCWINKCYRAFDSGWVLVLYRKRGA